MDTGLSVRSVPQATSPVVRTETTPVKSTVQTDLPARDAVTASKEADTGQAMRDSKKQDVPANETDSREFRRTFDLDAKTKDLVIKLMDPETGEEVFQIPSKEMLQLKAYARALMHDNEKRAGTEKEA
jgi:uncharacterized FlaG/YvyC family protein